jgi:hypothetical protein
MMSDKSLTLWSIEDSLVQLVGAREDAASDIGISEDERRDQLQVIDNALADYVRQEITKVDNVRSYLLHCRLMADAARAERAAMEARVRLWEARESRLKEICILALDSVAKKRVEGKTGSLSVRGNGGVQPLEISGWNKDSARWADSDPGLLPDEVCVWAGTVGPLTWRRIQMLAIADPQTKLERQPSNAAIREALGKSCPECGELPAPSDACQTCGGTGTMGIPGAHLEPRGRSLVVK